MSIADPADTGARELAAVVRYAVKRRFAGNPDYWDHATLLELAVVAGKFDEAADHLGDALALLDEPWKAKTTLDNLVPIARSRRAAGLEVTALEEIISELERHAPQPV